MRILQVSSASTMGGGEAHIIDLCRALAERGHEVHLAARPRNLLMDHLTLQPDRIHRLPLRNSVDVCSAYQLARKIKQHRYDIIHGHVARDYLVCVMARLLSSQGRLVLTRHHYLPIGDNWAYKRLLRRADKFIAVSESVRQGIMTSLSLPPNQVVTIPNWIDISRFQELPSGQLGRAKLGLEHPFIVGMVGQITPAKGQEEFIRAAALVSEQRDDVAFLIVGEELDTQRSYTLFLQRLAEDLGVSRRLKMIGWVEDLTALFPLLNLFILPSWNEAFSLVLVQAMASGLPVIASDIGGPKQIVRQGVTGLLVPPRDVHALAAAICQVLEDSALRGRLRLAAKLEAQQRFERERIINQIEDLYRELLDRD
jgi:L-malate glycosyltransferase